MSILFELRYPSRWYTKLLMMILALAFFVVLATAAVSVFLLYRIVKPQRTSSEINMQTFPGRPDAVSFSVAGLGSREGWFFPGFRGGATILLCHGYESSKGELLTLVSALQEERYNVMVFDFAGHGASPGITTLGYREAGEVRAAIDAAVDRGDVDKNRFGLWGYNLGAYATLSEAGQDKRVRAMVLDSVYDSPKEMVKVEVERSGLGAFPLMVQSGEFSFEWLNFRYRGAPPLSKSMSSLAGVPKLFIEEADDPELADTTREIFADAPEPKEQVMLAHGNYVNMADDDKHSYENRVVSFFLLHLPVLGRSGR